MNNRIVKSRSLLDEKVKKNIQYTTNTSPGYDFFLKSLNEDSKYFFLQNNQIYWKERTCYSKYGQDSYSHTEGSLFPLTKK